MAVDESAGIESTAETADSDRIVGAENAVIPKPTSSQEVPEPQKAQCIRKRRKGSNRQP